MKSWLKKEQVILYVIAIMVMTAGYLNFTTKSDENSVETSMQIESKDDTLIAEIGDAVLVNSSEIVEQNSDEKINENAVETNTVEIVKEDQKDKNKNNETDDYFVKSKLERNTMYSQILETYENVLNSNYSLETQKQIATEEITRINGLKNSIMICENLIGTKGFNNNVIFVNDDSINIIVEADELKPEEVAQIQNIITRELKVEIENIHIINKSK
ncbi:MAG: SpoIIIAH-like family protein [Clostridia bacterium]|nr:SpoIIIAH-like family protein [Clostridia bacterium]